MTGICISKRPCALSAKRREAEIAIPVATQQREIKGACTRIMNADITVDRTAQSSKWRNTLESNS